MRQRNYQLEIVTSDASKQSMAELKPLELGDHQLWPDGTITVKPEDVIDFTYKLNGHLEKLSVTSITPEIESYNRLADSPLTVKTSVDPNIFPPRWNLPEHYKYLDLDEYLVSLIDKIERDDLYEKRVARLSQEIWMFKELKLDDVLRALIYAVDEMKKQGVVWGIGRGSSCSSYILYLIDLHYVDPVRYDIEITDFIRLRGK